MLYQVCGLALCGTFALWGDVCAGLNHESSTYVDPPRTVSFRLSVKADVPSFRITVRPLAYQPYKGLVHAGNIEVAKCRDGKLLQSLPFMSDNAINFGATFVAEDINFDGYLDFSILTAFGAKWGSRTYWIYDPDSDRFIQTELTREFGELGTNGYHLDSKNHELSVENIMAGCPDLISRFHIEDNHLVRVHEEEGIQFIKEGSVKASLPPGVPCTVTYRDLVDGRMRVTRMRHFVDGMPVR